MTRVGSLRTCCALFALGLVLHTAPAVAQRATTAVVPDAITVGDVFHAAIRFDLPADVDVAAPDSLPLPENVESAGHRELRVDTAGGRRVATLIYPLTAWRPGHYALPDVTIRMLTPRGEQRINADLPDFDVRSVLPEDTTGIQMRAAKDVLGPNRIWWPWLLLLALLIAALLAYLWWRRRRQADEPVVTAPPIPARQVALERLAALRRSGMLERGELKPFYEELSETVRHYAPAVDLSWSVDLTTSELTHGIRARDVSLLDIVRVLGTADLVKFARARTNADAALRDLDAARAWIERTSVPEPPENTELDTRRVA